MTTTTDDGPAQPGARRRASFHRLAVSEVRPLTDDAVEIGFTIPVELADEFNYLPGQYVALRADIDGEEVRRSYSICAMPTKQPDGTGRIAVGIKRDIGGRFSTWATTKLQEGDELEVMSPQGAFTAKHALTDLNDPDKIAEESTATGRYVGIAAGSGITPIMSIAQAVLTRNPGASFDLIYANRSAGNVMFLDDLADLKDRWRTRLSLHHILSREQRISPLFSGRIDDEKLKLLLDNVVHPETVDEWFLCGPFELVQLARDTLADRGVPSERIRFELFTTGQPTGSPEGNRGRPVEIDTDGDMVEIEFNLDGLHGQVESPVSANESILNAALRVRGDVPFACAGGVCGTCRAMVVSGEVDMRENYALESDEVERGYVLTCQAYPTSEKVSVDYDA